jgi:drug/metabolite transporter (DMT)-like permease
LKIACALLLVSFAWGSQWLAIRIGLLDMPPLFSAGVRFVIACIILFFLIRVRRLPIPLDANAWKSYWAMGILTFVLPFALIYWGQQFVPTGVSSILFGVFPLWVAIFAHFMLKNERITLAKLLSIVIGFAGLFVIFWSDVSLGDSRTLIGMVTILASIIMQAYSLILVKRYGQPIQPEVLNFVGMVIGMVGVLGTSAVLEWGRPLVWSLDAILSLLYLAVVASVVAYVAYYWLLKRIEAVYLSLTSFISPVVAVVLGAVFLGEHLSQGVYIGAALVFVGILVANWKALYARFRSA